MTNGLLAVRRNLSPNAIFYKQKANHVYYSFDRTNWIYGWSFPVTTAEGGNGYYDFSKDYQTIINEGDTFYNRNTEFKTIINNFTIPNTRNEALEQAEGIGNTMFSPERLCYGYIAILRIARELGLAVQNGQLEQDDVDRFSEFTGIIPIVGDLISTAIDVISPDIVAMGALTDEQLEDYACCMYNATKNGAFDFADWQAVGTSCGLGAWDEIATIEMYSAFLAITAHEPITDPCPCEECYVIAPATQEVIRGIAEGKTVTTVSYNTGGNVFEMQAVVKFYIPNMVVTSIQVFYILKNYENVATPTPFLRYASAGTGGGTQGLSNLNLTSVLVDPSFLALIPITEFTLTLASSTCATCNASQTASFNDSWGIMLLVYVCGNPV